MNLKINRINLVFSALIAISLSSCSSYNPWHFDEQAVLQEESHEASGVDATSPVKNRAPSSIVVPEYEKEIAKNYDLDVSKVDVQQKGSIVPGTGFLPDFFRPFTYKGVKIDHLKILKRSFENWEELSEVIYETKSHAKALMSWNKGTTLNPGQWVYFASNPD